MIVIEVHGRPAPQGSKSFKGMRGGHAILVESSKRVAPWREDVKAAALATMRFIGQTEPLDGPLYAEMIFTVPKPASAPKRRRTYPDRTPDLSKLIRSTEDALTDAGVIADDARIVEYKRAAKVFPGEDDSALPSPGALICIWQVPA